MLCRLPALRNPHTSICVLDSRNADDAGKPPQLGRGCGKADAEGYAKPWELR